MTEAEERFASKVVRTANETCWHWGASVNPQGYGHFFYEGRIGSAHRFAHELYVGPIPDGMYVCHKCDNPGCVNPAHLFLGTATDNNRDKVAKGRHTWGNKTHCIRGHELSGDNLYVKPKKGLRVCRTCQREADKRHHHKHNPDAKYRSQRSDIGKRRAA